MFSWISTTIFIIIDVADLGIWQTKFSEFSEYFLILIFFGKCSINSAEALADFMDY